MGSPSGVPKGEVADVLPDLRGNMSYDAWLACSQAYAFNLAGITALDSYYKDVLGRLSGVDVAGSLRALQSGVL